MSPKRRWRIRKRDRISALPDSILCGILSLLPTKDAVTTSVLSKRWKPLCFFLPTLYFDDQPFPTFHHFRHFVYSVIHSRDIALHLQSLHLKCGNTSFSKPHNINSDLNRFVFAAVQRGIQHLNLEVTNKIEFLCVIRLPPSIHNCRTLIVLKLKVIIVDNLPPDVNFPSLKTLHLESVTFRRHGLLMDLLSGCPVLEDLQTKKLSIIYRLRSEAKVESFPNLIRADISNLYVPFTLLRNAQFLRAELKCTYYSHFPMFLCLTHLELIFDRLDKWHWDWLMGVLDQCPKLQNLTIDKMLSYGDRNGVCDDDWEDPQFVPECLSAQLRSCSLRGYTGTEFELQFAKYIMQNSSVLRTMTIDSCTLFTKYVKLQMLMKLSLCPRDSEACKLLFD